MEIKVSDILKAVADKKIDPNDLIVIKNPNRYSTSNWIKFKTVRSGIGIVILEPHQEL